MSLPLSIAPRIGVKALWTTLVTCVVFALVWVASEYYTL
jgi:hypothetical protein